MLGRLATVAGFGVLLHATYATSNYRDVLKLTQQDFSAVPLQIQLEVLIGTVLCLIGGCLLAGTLKPVVLTKGAPSMDAGSFRPDFVSFNTRAMALPDKVPGVY